MRFIEGDYGELIQIDDSGEIVQPPVYGAADAGVQPSGPITDPLYQDAAPGGGLSWLVSPGKATAEYVATAPETILPGDIINPAKLIVDAAGKYWRYQQQRAPTGEIYYTRTAASAAGLSPLMIAGIAALLLAAAA